MDNKWDKYRVDKWEQYRAPKKSEPKEPEQGLLKNIADYEMGLFPGIAHGVSDIGANITQGLMYPFNKGYEVYTGTEGFKVPRADFNRYAPQSGAGQTGKSIGNFISPFLLPAVGTETFVSKGASPLIQAGQRLATGGAIGGLESSPGSSTLGTAIGAAGSQIPQAIQSIGKAYNWLTKPSQSLAQLKEFEKKLINSLQGRTENVSKFEQEASKEAEKVFPGQHFVDTSKALSQALGANKKKLNSYFEKSYEEYGKGLIGQKKIQEPYKLGELHNQLSDIANVPRSTMIEASKVSPKITFSNILDESGNPFVLEVPSKNSTLKDYIRFMRETRDASGLAFKKAKSQNLTQSEKENLLDTGRKLQEISKDASSRVSKTMTEEEAKNFANINKTYETVGAPIKYNPVFAKAYRSDTKLGKISDSFYRELLQPENEGVRKFLFGSQDFKKALLGHVTEGKKNPLYQPEFDKKITKIESILKDKVMSGLMGVEEKKSLQSIVDMARHQKAILKQMDAEAARLGMTRKELEEQLATRTKIVGGAVAGTLGAQGLKYLIGKIFPAHND